MTRRVAAGLTALALGGCTLDPAYRRPDLPVAAAYPSADAAYQADRAHQPTAAQTTPPDLIGWRQVFTDPRLQSLIELALGNNRDLRIAVLNVAGAEAQFRAQRANLFPIFDLTGEITFEGNPTSQAEPSGAPSTTAPANGSALVPNASGTGHTISRLYTLGPGFTAWEIDLFGAVRSQTRSHFEQYLSQAETRRSMQISLVAQVAGDYVTLLADTELLKIAQQTLDAQTRSLGITRAMFDHGSATLLSLRQAETTVYTAQASVAQNTRLVAQDKNALTLVVGALIPDDAPPGRDLISEPIMSDLSAGLPSELLTRRPDILAAEHTLLSANALIGVARAAFFPSIALTMSGGYASSSLSQLITPAAHTWTFEPTITVPIFTWGQNRADLDFATIQKRIDIAAYERAIQTAFREVADALAARGTYLDQLAAQKNLVDADAEAYRLADLRFRSGVDNYLATLTSQQSWFSSQQTLVTLKALQLQNLLTLYKALGGGWYDNTPPPDAQPAGTGQ